MKRTVTITKHAHNLEPGDRLVGKVGTRARTVVAVERGAGLVVATFRRGNRGARRVFHWLERVRVKV